MTKKNVIGKEFSREFRFADVDQENRTVELAFSSEEPYERWFGVEVLSHENGACDLARLNDGANVLFNHNWGDVVGVVESARIDDDKVGRAIIRFGKDARGDWALAQIADGILSKVSVGYKIHTVTWEERKDEDDLVTVTKWEPLEVSIVTVPADASVGVGRSAEPPNGNEEIAPLEKVKGQEETSTNVASGEGNPNEEGVMSDKETKSGPKTPATPVDHDAIRGEGASAERLRIATIQKIGAQARGFDVAPFIEDGTSVDTVREKALEFVSNNNRSNALPVNPTVSNELGLSGQERSEYSILKLVRTLSDPSDQGLREAAAFELEVSRAAGGGGGRRAVIPMDIVGRALNSNTDGAVAGNTGGHLIGTEHRADDMISQIYTSSFAMSNATFLDGLIGDVEIPLENGLPTAQWIGEDEEADESSAGYGMVKLSPFTLSAKSLITRKMIVQTSGSMERLLRGQLARAVAIKADETYFYGVASEASPGGLAFVDGINIKEIGANPTFEDMVEMETKVADYTTDNSNRKYMLSRALKGKLKTTKIDAGSGQFVYKDGEVNEYPAHAYDFIQAAHGFFGDPKHSYVGMWGEGLTIQVNDPREGTGTVPVTIFSDMDIKFPHPLTMTMAKPAA